MKTVTIIFVFLAMISNKIIGQTYYSENFQSGLNGWVTNDLDGDSNSWFIDDASRADPILGTKSLVSLSKSFDGAPFTPNNLATSPLINLAAVTATNLFFEFDHLVDNAPDFAEHYAIYVTTVNVPSTIVMTTPVFETTVGAEGYKHEKINLASYIGQSIYISFRHFDCANQGYLIIDNLELKSLVPNNVSLIKSNLPRYLLINNSFTVNLDVKNSGNNDINSLTVNWNDGTNHTSVISTSIAVGASKTISLPIAVQYSTVLEKDITFTITNVNAVIDPLPLDNVDSKKINTISQNSVKKVVFEEGTGTWCGYCPRGAVAMNYMETTFPNDFIGVAVHQGDPMALPDYINSARFLGYPSMNVDRIAKGEDVTQTVMVDFLNKRKILAVPVTMESSGSITGNNLVINAKAVFKTVFANANYRLGVIISEDKVKGTTTGYNQANYYVGGALGVMGGYETKPNPVPAAQMVYNHVGRAILGGYSGQTSSVPNVITDGQQVNYTFNYTVPTTSIIANMHAVLVLIDQSNGEIVNASKVNLSTLSNSQNDYFANKVLIFPNPTNQKFNIQGLESGTYKIEIFDMNGKSVQNIEKVNIELNETKSFDLNNLSKGNYIINASTQGASFNKHLIIE